jgi:hypothetical protein
MGEVTRQKSTKSGEVRREKKVWEDGEVEQRAKERGPGHEGLDAATLGGERAIRS